MAASVWDGEGEAFLCGLLGLPTISAMRQEKHIYIGIQKYSSPAEAVPNVVYFAWHWVAKLHFFLPGRGNPHPAPLLPNGFTHPSPGLSGPCLSTGGYTMFAKSHCSGVKNTPHAPLTAFGAEFSHGISNPNSAWKRWAFLWLPILMLECSKCNGPSNVACKNELFSPFFRVFFLMKVAETLCGCCHTHSSAPCHRWHPPGHPWTCYTPKPSCLCSEASSLSNDMSIHLAAGRPVPLHHLSLLLRTTT